MDNNAEYIQVTKAHGTQHITRAQTHSSSTPQTPNLTLFTAHSRLTNNTVCFLASQVELLSPYEELNNLAINTTCFFLAKNKCILINYDLKYKRQPANQVAKAKTAPHRSEVKISEHWTCKAAAQNKKVIINSPHKENAITAQQWIETVMGRKVVNPEPFSYFLQRCQSIKYPLLSSKQIISSNLVTL